MSPALVGQVARFFTIVGCVVLAVQFGYAASVSYRRHRTNWLMVTLCASYTVMAVDYFIGLLSAVHFEQTGVSIAPDSLPWLVVKAAAALTAGAVVLAWEYAKRRDPGARTRAGDA